MAEKSRSAGKVRPKFAPKWQIGIMECAWREKMLAWAEKRLT
ncbi:hypothetical protein [Methylocaldum marinum]|nr:hypothetical protein [Methylocaldum marinum]